MRFRTSISNDLFREEENHLICSPALCVGLELLSIEHLLLTSNSHPHLALAICTKTISVSAHPTLTLEVTVQYKCLLSVKYSISLYNIILEQLVSKLIRRLPRSL